jgi:ABC-type sugar transport system ATPase subunit
MELATGSARIRLSPSQAQVLASIGADRVVVGIRAEHLTPLSEPRRDDFAVHGTVEAVEMLGAEQYVHIMTDGGSLTARLPRSQPVKVDQALALAANPDALHLFHLETGVALR